MKMEWTPFVPRLGTWAEKLKPFYDSGGFDVIYDYLKAENSSGKKIAPDSRDTYRCFIETPLPSLKAVIVGMCPYHSVINGVIVADGLAMGCSKTRLLQPTLHKFYEGLEMELHKGLCLTCYWNANVAYLAHQGILMLNAALTTETGQPGAHQELWKPFMACVLKEVAKHRAPIVFLGKDASELSYSLESDYPYYELTHPVSAAYKSTKSSPFIWETQGVFTKVNDLLADNGIKPILWLEEKLHELDE